MTNLLTKYPLAYKEEIEGNYGGNPFIRSGCYAIPGGAESPL